jgi:hypothetical protein
MASFFSYKLLLELNTRAGHPRFFQAFALLRLQARSAKKSKSAFLSLGVDVCMYVLYVCTVSAQKIAPSLKFGGFLHFCSSVRF